MLIYLELGISKFILGKIDSQVNIFRIRDGQVDIFRKKGGQV